MTPVVITALIVVFIAAFVRSTVGFGDALLAMPILVVLLGLPTAVPLVGLLGVSTAIVLLSVSWRSVDLRAVVPLLLAALAGVPVGVTLLKRLEGDWLVGILGFFLLLFGLYRLIGPKLPTLRNGGLAIALGFMSGLLGGAYNVSGPFAVLYGGLRGWTPEVFRASLQGFFIVTSIIIAGSHGAAGLWTREVLVLYLFALPLSLIAIRLGNMVAARAPAARLERLINGAIVLLGVGLLVT